MSVTNSMVNKSYIYAVNDQINVPNQVNTPVNQTPDVILDVFKF